MIRQKREEAFVVSELPVSERPREKLVRSGVDGLSDLELLAIIIGSGGKGAGVGLIAGQVLTTLDLSGNRPILEQLLQIKGIGSARAASVCASLEFARRRLCPSRKKITSPADVLPLVSHYADRRQECFLCLALNGAHEVTAIRVVSLGLVNRTIVHPREVFADPLQDRAASVLVAHNHPSGNVDPSEEDRAVTRRLLDAGETLGIRLLDHVIFSESGYYSFLEHDAL